MAHYAFRCQPSLRITIRRISLVLLLMAAVNSLGDSVFSGYAYAATQGQTCTKVGLKNGFLVCAKVKGKLIWQSAKKQQSLSAQFPVRASINSKTISIKYSASSGLPVKTTSTSLTICTIANKIVSLISPGYCVIRLSQLGNSQFLGATTKEIKILIVGSNQISFSLPSSLLLSSGTYPLAGTSTSGLAVTYESLTADICSVSGTILTPTKLGLCTIRASQSGSNIYEPAPTVDASITISYARVTSDQTDVVTGFQVKAIYVVPSDGIDHSYDTNGYIAGILDEGNKYLNAQLGLQIPIDKDAVGYDIQYMKSNLTTAYLQTANDLTDKLLAESMALENPGVNRKDYIFFIDVRILVDGKACGIGNTPGISAVVAIGEGADATGVGCTGKSLSFDNYAAKSWPHELFHNFGVKHTLDTPCDLMTGAETPGSCPTNEKITIDKEHSRYVRSSLQGQDILKLRVWEGYTDRQDLQANCSLNPVPRADGFNYAYCPTGNQTIGALRYCWSSIYSVSLEEFINGSWISLGTGSHYSDPWGPEVVWKCTSGSAPWKELTVTTPGISLYRWIVNGKEAEQFKVIWVR